ncbi:MAG: glycoside hydrolase family 38 C-terminal domain-containing protein [Actinocatenispora sp.]
MSERRTSSTDRPRLHLIGNAHLDPVWLWQWPEGYQEARATLWSAVHRLDEYPDLLFTCDQVVLLAWVEESDPELFDRLAAHIRAGRIEVVGGWWVEPDCNLPHGESFVRQGLYGQRYLREKFGVTATVGCNVDPFGHHVMIPQILRQQGMHAYCFLRPGPHECRLPGSAFRWQSPDGSQVLAYRIAHEYCGPRADVGNHIEKAVNQVSGALEDVMVFYGVGNHGGGPTVANIDSIRRLDQLGTFGPLEFSSPARYFDRLADVDLPTWHEDLQLHAVGCYSAHSGVKQWNRRAEQALLEAERWAAVGAAAHGLDYPREELGRAWKQVLFNQFHDILPGSAVESAYTDARDQLGEAVAVARRITNRSIQVIARQVHIDLDDRTQPLLVFNPHPWRLTADVEVELAFDAHEYELVDDDGAPTPAQNTRPHATVSDPRRRRISFGADLPPLGYRRYTLRPRTGGTEPYPAHPGGTVLENAYLRLEVDPTTGWLSSLRDKRTGLDLVAGATGAHTVVSDDPSDTWGHRVISYDAPGRAFTPTSVRLVEHGPWRSVLRVDSRCGSSSMAEEFVLTRDADVVAVRVTLNWQETLSLGKLRVPTALVDPDVTYEVPFGHYRRPADGAEKPGQSWVDLSGTLDGRPAGLAVVNDAKHGYDVTGASLGITMARSPVYAWHDPMRLASDGVYSYQDQGVQSFTYLLVPHAGDWRAADLPRRTAKLLMPVRPMLESFHPGPLPGHTSYAADDAGPVVVTAVKGAEDPGGDVVVRAVETHGRAARARIELPMLDRVLEVEFGPSQIRTFRVPRDPSAPVLDVDLVEWPTDAGADLGASEAPPDESAWPVRPGEPEQAGPGTA